ncbi:MAG: dioxygenase [Archangium sp.]|nr:dioxygenase [Archangium sp.]
MSAKDDSALTRRQTLTAAGVVVAGTAVGLAAQRSGSEASTKMTTRMPAVFLPHGGGPWPFVDLGWGDERGMKVLATYLSAVGKAPAVAPKALLVISAHWEERVPTVMTSVKPPMLFDYYGFPPAAYAITWPAPGAPWLAERVNTLLRGAGFPTATDAERGFDHGTFVPLKLAYPAADIPTVQLSLIQGLDPAAHVAMGRALAPLRDEGVFIIGSGMTFHDLRTFRDPRLAGPVSETFDGWLREAATAAPAERDAKLTRWTTAPVAREAHPREEHLIPLMVIAGAAGDDVGTVTYGDTYMGIRLSAYQFG